MIRRLLVICVLAMAFASIANAQVVWTYSGGSAADATVWEDADNWTKPLGNAYDTPTAQYFTSTSESERSFINNDVTKIVISGYTVEKLQPNELGGEDDLYMGGTDCWLELNSGASLTVGDDLKNGRNDFGYDANGTIKVLNGSVLDTDEFYVGDASGSTCNTTVSGGSELHTDGTRIGISGSATLTVTGTGSSWSSTGGVDIGRNTGSYGEVVISNDADWTLTADDIKIGYGDSEGWVKVQGTDATHLSEVSGIDDLTVASGAGSVGRLVLSHATFSTGDSVNVAYGDESDGQVTVTNATFTIGDGTGEDLCIGRRQTTDTGLGGTGLVTINSGGLMTLPDDIYLARDDVSSQGTLTVNAGGTVDCGGSLKLGDYGAGIVNIYGTMDVVDDANVANHTDSSGTVNIFNGGELNVDGILKTNDGNETSSGSIIMTGGDLNVGEALILAYKGDVGSEGIFTLSGGTVDIECNATGSYTGLILGDRSTDADATLNIDGGTMTVAGAIYMGSLIEQESIVGSDSGELRINIDGGILQAEDYIDEGTFSNHLITLTDGFLKLASANVSELEMASMIGADISCPNGYAIYTEGDYTVLTTPIPEPATIVMVLFGLASLALIRRKK